jgi:hypothetical protein
MEVASVNLKLGPLTIGRDDRPWIVRQVTTGRTRFHLRGFVPDLHRGGDRPHFHFDRRASRLDRLANRVGWTARDSGRPRWLSTLGPYAAALACGALVAYVFDPTAGRRRRAIARDRAIGVVNRAGRRLTRLGRAAGATYCAWVGKATHPRFTLPPPVDDVVLVDRVKAVLFREHDFPKGRISIDAANGCVSLRGEIERYEQIDQIESVVWGIPGVSDIENLLHMAGTPAPNTITALEASH